MTAATQPMTDHDTSYLNNLNPPQRLAVETLEGRLLVLAGAGTGKTRVLTTRIVHILATRHAAPHQILAVTFTNKAASEMKERVFQMLGIRSEGMWLGTFHSVCVRILRYHSEAIDLDPNFTILDTDDQLRLIKQILNAEQVDDKKFPPRSVATMIGRWKDKALSPDQVSPLDPYYSNLNIKLYKLYQERLRTLNAVDFGDLLLECIRLFQNNPDILKHYQSQFRHILVDEYQDTNVAQYLWLRLLASPQTNLCCVGDDDQSIYGWRGAEIGNILKFEKDFNDATIIRLEQNYRSSAHILAAASSIIAKNTGRLGKSLWTQSESGDKVFVQAVYDGEEEARFVGEQCDERMRKGHPLNQIAILVRAGFQTREFEERFLVLGLPYRVIGGPRFYERLEIRDALAYLRIVALPTDSLAFERIINTPRRGIGASTLQQLHQSARDESISLFHAAQRCAQRELFKGTAKTAIKVLLQDIERWHLQSKTLKPCDLARIVLDESGYTSMWQQDKSPEAPGRLENLKELVSALEDFDTLSSFLEHVSLVMENANSTSHDMISIMTLHGAKGLEFDTVFLCGWEEGVFPHSRALDESGNNGLEEERRLAYVGLTRAKHHAIITYAQNRRLYNQWQHCLPSRFIQELDQRHIIHNKPVGFYNHHQRQQSNPYFENRKNKKQFDWIDLEIVQDFDDDDHEYKSSFHDQNRVVKLTKTNPVLYNAPKREKQITTTSVFEVGERVVHAKFGAGIITHKDGHHIDVNFDDETISPKTILDRFLTKES